MKPILAAARQAGYAVGAFNPVDYLSTKAIIDAATEQDAPVIVQMSAKTVRYWGLETLAEWVKSLADRTPVPITLHLDHGKDLDMIEACMDHGWTSVMIDASDKPYEINVSLTRRVYEQAELRGIGIEAELGAIGGVEEDISVDEEDAHLVNVEQAIAFCETFDLAVFAPAIGTAHGIYKGEPRIAFDRLEELGRKVSTPFALHGGTGLSDEIIQRCIRLGCSKVNISTNLKHTFIDSFCDYHREKPGDYEPLRLIEAQYQAVKQLVSEKISQFGGVGKAAESQSLIH